MSQQRVVAPQLIQTSEIRSLLELPVDDATLVCLDIDDVLLQTTQYIGSEKWEADLVAELQTKHGMPEPQARGTAGQVWRALHWVVDSECPEGVATAEVTRTLQQRAVRVIGLTARDEVLIPLTDRQLTAAGISFAGDKPVANRQLGVLSEEGKPTVLSGGIIFCGGASKREALLAFLREPLSPGAEPMAYPPPIDQIRSVVHVDDKHSHLKDLVRAFGGEGAGDLRPEDLAVTQLMSFTGVHCKFKQTAASRFVQTVAGPLRADTPFHRQIHVSQRLEPQWIPAVKEGRGGWTLGQ